jgi:serine/threonine-protein kinase
MQLIDTELAGCRIVEEIGHGGMAVVFRAYQARLERWVAVKVLRPDLLVVKEFLDRFRREARSVAKLRHPNILSIYDYGEEHGLAYIVMEYVTGGKTLKDLLSGEPWAWSEAVSLLAPVGQALAFAHTERIVHRDVKPANILLPRDDWPLLSDFGLVKLLEAGQTLTQPGVGLGTLIYAAPEQMLGGSVDHRADIYGLGMVLYELVTGRLPFTSDVSAELIIEQLSGPPAPARQINPAVPAQLEEILLQALAPKPADRFGRMEELLAALDALSRGASQSPAADMSPGPLRWRAHLTVDDSGALISLSARKELLVGRTTPRSQQVPDIDLSAYGGGQSGVSRVHARLARKQARWYLEDMNSTNGTFVNGERLSPGQVVLLNDGDSIRFGRLTVTFQGAPDA